MTPDALWAAAARVPIPPQLNVALGRHVRTWVDFVVRWGGDVYQGRYPHHVEPWLRMCQIAAQHAARMEAE